MNANEACQTFRTGSGSKSGSAEKPSFAEATLTRRIKANWIARLKNVMNLDLQF
jgi:hypothetical protein